MKLKCPICKQPVDSETNAEFPFCSERCRERDLGNWAMEKYKVAVPMMDESEPEEIETNEPAQPEHSDPTTSSAGAKAARLAGDCDGVWPRLSAESAGDVGLARRRVLGLGRDFIGQHSCRTRRSGVSPATSISYLVANFADELCVSHCSVAMFGRRCATRTAYYLGKKDPQIVVIDEVSGQLISYFGIGAGRCLTGNICCWALYFFVSSIFGSHFRRGKPNPSPAAWESWPTTGLREFTRRWDFGLREPRDFDGCGLYLELPLNNDLRIEFGNQRHTTH